MYRWKNQRREPDYANPDKMGGYRPASEGFPQEPTFEQILGNRAYQQMQGYVPGEPDAYRQDNGDAIYAAGLMQGYRPTPAYGETAFDPATASKDDIIAMQKRLGVGADGIWGKKSQAAYDAAFGNREPYTDLGRRSGGDAGASVIARSEQILAQIKEVQAELDKVNAEIEAFDRANPGLKGMTDEQREIAAQRASIGDMSAYDSMVQRGAAGGAQAVNTIENALMDAEKLTWGLSLKGTQEQLAARNQIEVAMRKAERDAAQSGLDVTKIPSYQRLQAALAGAGSSPMNNNALVNMYKWKMENGTLTNADRKYVDEVIRKDMNSEDFDKLFGFLQDSKGKTVEAKGKAKAEKEKREALYRELVKLGPSEQMKRVNALPEKERKAFVNEYKFDEKTGFQRKV